jgi:hypothetical protein
MVENEVHFSRRTSMVKPRLVFLVLMLVLVVPLPLLAQSKGTVLREGFLKGQDWTDTLDDNERIAYIMGAIDGFLFAPAICPNLAKFREMEKCLEGLDNYLAKLLIEQYIKDHPEQKNQPLHSQVYNALREACAKFSQK